MGIEVKGVRRAGTSEGRGQKAGVLYISMAEGGKTCPGEGEYLNGMLNLHLGEKSA